MRTQGESQESAAWKQRFRTPVVLWAMIAKDAPARGLAASNFSGVTQLCAWDVPTGSLRALTTRPEGVLSGLLSSDGRYVYYAGDRAGSEIGHHVRVSWEGGVVEDVTPDLPPYSSIGFALSRSGTLAGLITAAADGYRLYGLDLEEEGGVGAPRCLYHSPVAIYGPALSYDATLAVITCAGRLAHPAPSSATTGSSGNSAARASGIWQSGLRLGPHAADESRRVDIHAWPEVAARSPLAARNRVEAHTRRAHSARCFSDYQDQAGCRRGLVRSVPYLAF